MRGGWLLSGSLQIYRGVIRPRDTGRCEDTNWQAQKEVSGKGRAGR